VKEVDQDDVRGSSLSLSQSRQFPLKSRKINERNNIKLLFVVFYESVKILLTIIAIENTGFSSLFATSNGLQTCFNNYDVAIPLRIVDECRISVNKRGYFIEDG